MDKANDSVNKNALTEAHRRILEVDSCISPSVLKRAVVYSGSNSEIKSSFGVSRPGIVFPYFGLAGEPLENGRVRFDEPLMDNSGREQRYHQRKGTELSCYFLPDTVNALKDPDVDLVITEGEKKGLCLASQESLYDKAIVSIPGCWNFVKKGERSLSTTWQQIPLKGRTVHVVFDTDYFTNPNVTRAGDHFLKLLFESGAVLKIVDLRDPHSTAKLGVDDFICRSGASEFLERFSSPAWILDKKYKLLNNLEPSDESIRQILEHVVILPSVAIDSLLYEIKSKTKVTLGNLREIYGEVLTKWKTLRPGSSGHSSAKVIRIDKSIQTREILTKVANTLRDDGRFFNYADELLLVDNGDRFLVTPQTLPGVMSDLGVEFATAGRECMNYYVMPQTFAQILCQSKKELRSDFNEIVLFTDHPTYDRNWNLIPPGYHEEEGIFYFGSEIEPRRELTLVNSAIQDFAFKNEASRVNFIAMMLTAILRNRYRGDRPFAAVTANKPQIGKTLACKVVSIIAEGRFPQTMSFVRNQDEMEKQIAARLVTNDILQIDNVKSAHPIDSPPLERLVTDDPISFRVLGHTRTICRPNTILTFVTMNDAKFCKDLITRALPIELYHDELKDPSSRVFARDNLAEFVLQNRMGIISEICGMVEVWKESGYPLCPKNFRFKLWAKEIGGILYANGMHSFLNNYESAASTYDRISLDLAAVFEQKIGLPVTASELVATCEELGLFPDIVGTKKAPTSLSHLIGKYIDKPLQLPNGMDTIVIQQGKTDRTGTKTYIADLQVDNFSAWTMKADAGTHMDVDTEDPSTLSDCNALANPAAAWTAGTETALNIGAKKSGNGKGLSELPKSKINPAFVPAVPANNGNDLLSQKNKAHGQAHGQETGVPAHSPGSMHAKGRGNGMDWGDAP